MSELTFFDKIKSPFKGTLFDKYYDGILDFAQSFIVSIVICILIYTLLAMPNQINGESMMPTFYDDEIVLTSKLSVWFSNTDLGNSAGFTYQRGDVIVFRKPDLQDDYIKRIIGMPGDSIRIDNGKVYVNEVELDESSYLSSDVYTRGSNFIKSGDLPKVVPEHHYFVMGDNRGNSHDSRAIDVGFINKDWIKGKVVLKYWPLNHLRVFNKVNYNL